ncbi:MAG: CYTH domain-containing protein, partial [Candidatus Thiodiazotropha sp.]
MAIEIERKYLVINDNWKENVVSQAVIKQGYLATTEQASVRVRVDGEQANLNIKGTTVGISRREYEYPIPLQQAEEMLDHLVSGAVIDKVRYKVRHGEHIWDLDRFMGANEGLVVAEVELRLLPWMLLILLCACQGTQEPPIRMALSNVPLNLDPRFATDATSERINRLLYRRLPQIEMAMGDQVCVLIFRVLSAPSAEDLEQLAAFGPEHQVVVYLQEGGPETVRPLDGKGVELTYDLPAFDVTLAFEPSDFTQVNSDINRQMIQRAVDMLELT